jgi:hypothetical protein
VTKKRKAPAKVVWMEEPDEHDFPAASDFLSLLFSESAAAAIVDEFRGAPVVYRKTKDLLRAGRLELLPADDHEVARDLKKVAAGGQLSPVLVVRGRGGAGVPLIVADGYHRICASYHLDEATEVACRLVDSK